MIFPKFNKLFIASAAFIVGISISSNALAVSSFSSAKTKLPQIYAQLEKEGIQPTTIYCNYPITITHKGKRAKWTVDSLKYGYEVRRDKKRAQRIEAEHVMPAFDFGRNMQCWQNGGRKNCENSKIFREMEGELHNLFPAVGEINNDRSNFGFGAWNEKGKSIYGSCPMFIDRENKRVLPPEYARGIIARAYLFMEKKYNVRLSRQDKRLFEAWNNQYAPNKLECRRNELIEEIQGYDNPFITKKCSN